MGIRKLLIRMWLLKELTKLLWLRCGCDDKTYIAVIAAFSKELCTMESLIIATNHVASRNSCK